MKCIKTWIWHLPEHNTWKEILYNTDREIWYDVNSKTRGSTVVVTASVEEPIQSTIREML